MLDRFMAHSFDGKKRFELNNRYLNIHATYDEDKSFTKLVLRVILCFPRWSSEFHKLPTMQILIGHYYQKFLRILTLGSKK